MPPSTRSDTSEQIAHALVGEIERTLEVRRVALAAIQIERVEPGLRRREENRTEAPPLAAGDVEERERDRLRPDLFRARHGGARVEADDHRSATSLVVAAQTVLQERALDVASLPVAAKRRMAEGQQLLRQHARDVVAGLDLVDFIGRPLEEPVAEREGLFAHAAEQRRELAELRIARQPTAELQAPSDRACALGAERSTPALGLVGGIVERLRHTEGFGLEPLLRHLLLG